MDGKQHKKKEAQSKAGGSKSSFSSSIMSLIITNHTRLRHFIHKKKEQLSALLISSPNALSPA